MDIIPAHFRSRDTCNFMKKHYAIALAHNTKDDNGKAFGDDENSPSRRRVIVLHQEVLDKMSELGFDLITVDNGIAYFCGETGSPITQEADPNRRVDETSKDTGPMWK